MILGLCRIAYLCALVIVTIGIHEETRVASKFDYVEESCINLMPSQMMEANMSSQAGEDAPFRASFMNNNEAMYTYKPSHKYRIIISSEDDDLFMGFIANMRLASNPSVIVGTVILPQDNNTLVKTMTCNGTNNTATQLRITQHSSVEFIWIAPADLNETVILRFGVFKNLSLFWNDLHTPCIVPEGVNLFPSVCNDSLSITVTSVFDSSNVIQVQTSSLSSITTRSRSKSVGITRSSSLQSTIASTTQLNSSPSPSVSKVSRSTVIESEHLTRSTPTKSDFLLPTYTYTSINMPSSMPVVIDATSADMVVTSSLNRFATTLTAVPISSKENALSTSTTDMTDDGMTSSSIKTATMVAASSTSANTNILSAVPTAVTNNSDDGLLRNTSEMIAVGIAIGFLLTIIVSQIFIVIVGCICRRRQNKPRSRSLSFRTLYSLDTASVRSESIRRSYRLYNRDQVDLKLNIIEVDECPSNNKDSSSVPHTEDNHNIIEVDKCLSSNNNSSSVPHSQNDHDIIDINEYPSNSSSVPHGQSNHDIIDIDECPSNSSSIPHSHNCQPSNSDLVSANLEADVHSHSTDH